MLWEDIFYQTQVGLGQAEEGKLERSLIMLVRFPNLALLYPVSGAQTKIFIFILSHFSGTNRVE